MKPPRILVVTDCPGDVDALMVLLSESPWSIDSVTNKEAPDAVTTRKPAVVVIFDKSSSPLDFELCRRIKSNPATRATLVLIIARPSPDDIKLAVEAGVDDFVVAPPRQDELVKRISSLLKLRQLRS